MKLKIFIFFGFTILVESILTQIEIDIQSLDDDPSGLEFEWEIISEFMKDQHVVTLFVEKYYEDAADKIFKYSLKNHQAGFYHYNNKTLISQVWLSFQKHAVFTNRLYGGILVMDDLDLMNIVINSSANNRLVLVLFDVNIDKIKTFMRNIWDTQKTFEMITLSIHTNGQNTIVQLNPFESKFFEYPINSNDSSKIIVELINYRYKIFMNNMAGYGIKVFIIEAPLFSVLIRNASGNVIDYSSVDGTLVKLCQKYMNFTPIYITDHIAIERETISSSGAINVIDDGYAEVGINNRFILEVSYNNTVFLYPTDKIPMSYVVPINYEEVPLKVLTYDCFDLKSRIAIALSLIFLSAIWMLGRQLVDKNVETATETIPLKVIALLHSVSVISPRSVFNQIVFITIAFFSLLLTSVYQGTVVEQLNNPLKPHQLESLKDLLNSNLNISTLTLFSHSVEKSKRDKANNAIMVGEMGRKAVMLYDSIQEGLDMVGYNKTTALMMPIYLYTPFSVKYFNKTTGLDLLHLIKESSTSILVSYVIARNSPYIGIFNHVIRLSIESGILNHEITVATDQQRLYYIRRIKNGYAPKDKHHFRPIKLTDIIYLRLFAIINWSLGIIVFLLEHVIHFVLKCKQQTEWFRRRTDLEIN